MKGHAAQTKVHFKGNEEDFVILVESKDDVLNWKKDKSVPLSQVVSGWKIFVTHKYVRSRYLAPCRTIKPSSNNG